MTTASDHHSARQEGAVKVSIARLPATGGELFGREADLAWLDGCWAGGVHVASVVAWGGVGKSALVNMWLAGLRDKGWEGAERVYGWSFYSQGTDRLSSSDEFVDAALRWFGDVDPKQGSPWDKGERLARLVRQHRTILVLDGVEPLQWGPGVQAGRLKDPALEALVKELAAQNKGLCLVTSRIGVTDLEGLSGDKVRAKALDNLSPEAGAQLLTARGTKGTDDEELRAASEEYEGHALALSLLGSYLADVANGDIRRRKEIGPLEEYGGYAQRVMAAYEGWLGKVEAAILHMIGLFDRPASEDEIAAVRADPIIPGLTDALAGISKRDWSKAITKLQQVGLLSVEHHKLDAHPLVREHFGEQLKREHPEAWREGHRRLYDHLKEKAKPLPETIKEMARLYAAVVHGCMAGKNQEAFREVYWKRIQRGNEHFNPNKLGAFGSEVAVLSAFFDPPWERLAPGLNEPDQALVLHEAGFALRALGRLSEAAALTRLSLEHFITQKNWKQAAANASNISELLQTHGELREALAEARKSVELADKGGGGEERWYNRTTLAAAQHATGRQAEAAAQFEAAERMQEDWQPDYPLLYSLPGFLYCDLLLDEGRDPEVRERAAQTLEWGRTGYSLLDLALDHLSLGRAHLLGVQRGTGGDLALATSYFHQAIDSLHRAGDQDMLARGLLARAALHTHTRSFPAAHHDIDEALTLATRCEFRLHEADAHLAYARLSLAEGQPILAREHLAKARAIIGATGYHRRDRELLDLESQADMATRTWLLALLDTPIDLDTPSPAVPGRTSRPPQESRDKDPRDLLRDIDTAPMAWQRSQALLGLLTGPRSDFVGGVELDLRREAAVRIGLTLGAKDIQASDWLRFETLALQRGAALAQRKMPDDPERRVRAAWLYGERIVRVLRESPLLGADPNLLVARLEALLPEQPKEDPDALWPARIGAKPGTLRLDELWSSHALYLAREQWEPPGAVLDALRLIAGRTINDAERSAEEALEAGHDALGWPGAHLAPPLAARWLLNIWRAMWISKIPPEAQTETLQWLERWIRSARAPRGAWVMVALHGEAERLESVRGRARALWTRTLDIADKLGDATGPYCLWGSTYLGTITEEQGEALVDLACRAVPAWRVSALHAIAGAQQKPEISRRAREALLGLITSTGEQEMNIYAAVASLQLARKLPKVERDTFVQRAVDTLSPDLRANPYVRLELSRVGRAA